MKDYRAELTISKKDGSDAFLAGATLQLLSKTTDPLNLDNVQIDGKPLTEDQKVTVDGRQGEGAVNKGCGRTQRNPSVHVGRTVPQALEAADEELLIDDHDDHRQQQLQKPHCHMVAVKKGWQRPAPQHVPH